MDDLRGFLMEEMAVEGSAGITLTALRQAIEAYEEERIKQNGGLKQLLDESWTNYVWRSMRGIPGVVAGGLKTVAEARQEQAPRSNDEPSNHDATPSAGDAATKGKRRQKQAIQSFLDTINVDAETRSADISQLETRHTDRLRFGLTRELLLAKLTKGDASSTMSDLTFATLQIVVRSKSAGVSFPEIGAVLGIDSKTIFHHVRVLTQKNLVSKYNETRNKARVAAVVANRFREGNAVWKMEQNSVMAVEKASKAGKNAKSQQQQQRAEHADEGADADADADAAQEEEEDDKAQDEENEEAKMLSIEPSLLETRMVLGATQDSAALHAEEDFLAVLDSSTATRGSVPPVNQQKDVKEAAAEAVEGLEGEDAETLLAYPQLTKMEGQVLARDTSKVLLVRIIRLAYLSSNHILPRKFIRQRLGWHGHAGAFGSAAGVKNRISARIYSALNAGYLDNVRAKTSSGGVQNCIRLLPAGIKWSEEFLSSAKDKAMARVTASLKYELNRLQQGRIARGVPLERQLSEIVCATGLTGISTMQLAAVLGATYQGRRSIDHLMRSMEESYNGPVNRISRTMCDALIVAATDHSGRLKYARYWSQLAHACLRKGSSLDATQEGDVTWDEAQAIHQWPLSEQAPPAISREEVAKAWRTALKEGTDAAPEADEDNDASGRARKKSKATGNHADSPVAPKKRGRPRKEKTEPDPNTPVVKKRRPYPLKPFESLTLAGQRSRIKIDKRNREEAEAAADAAAAERALDMLEVQGEHEAQDATAGIDDEPLLTPQEQVDADAHDPEESLERSASIREASRNVPEVSANASPAAATSASPAPSASAAARSATPANTSNRGRLRAMGRTKARSLNHSQARDSWLKTQRAKYGRDLMEKIGVVDFIMLPVEYQKYVQGVLSADAAQMEVGNCQDVRTRRQMVDALVEVGAVKTFKCISHLTGRQVEVIHHKDCPWEKVQQYTQTLSTSEHSVLTRSAQMRAVWRAAPLAGVQVDVPEALQANKAPRDMGPFSHIFSTQELLDNPKHHETLWQLSLARYQLLGYLPGSIARLRHLHRALVAILVGKPAQVFSYVCSSIGQPDSPSGEVPAIVSRPKSIISIDKLVNDTIQLRHIFKMFAIEPEEEVVQLAQSSQQCVMALGRQTERIRGSMQQTVKLQILQYFQRLHILGLVEPVMWQPNEEDDDKDHCWISTENQETSEFYEVKLGYMSQLGVTRQGNASFVARSLPLFSVEDCDAYWSTMFARNYALKHPSIQADKLKDAPVSVLLGLDLHWSRHRSSRYYLLTAQKQFLELFVKDARRSASSQTQDEGNVFFDNVDRIRRIAKAVVMPVWALVQYLLTMSKTTLPDGHPLKSLRHTSEEDGRSPSAFRGRRLLRQEGAPRGADLVPALDLNETAQSAVGESAEAREKKIEEREARREEWDEALRELLREAGFELAHDKVWEAMRVLRNTYAKTPDELTLDEGLDSARSAIKALRDELNPESAAQHAEKPMTAAEKERERKRQLRAFAKEYRADKESGPVRPDTSFRQRHSALMWTKASDELLRDAAVILRARDKERNAIQTNWIALRQIFPFAYRQGTVIKRYRYLISTIGEAAYLDELEAQWTRLWKKYRGTQYLEDLHPGHPTLFDLPQHIRFLRSHIDKENM
ncbi:hypothetical protein IE81DRAFT_201700 [Ceraceosorus guamensis]|uniref:B-block binding subunit of TFIIIC domain-containing protein n=1 Tax=Ceraceosorus guamensis TaxID=1522189 RepID=A0A316VWN9_9BASI|nr:hypothetical protein IE81DRAFT_201700 [Ceraceosorus guamensis]PWN40863.1 hypothetical protein IE81DRAFT_201700 [Ceraceosorus guamensis]